ncbi:MAG: hypothetical protein ACHQT8_08050 [Chlamydiales bacterium]
MKFSNRVTLVVIVPETHADQMRKALGEAGAGKIGNYSHCSFSSKGIGRFKPEQGARPFIGKEGVLESVGEERIETVCSLDQLEKVISAIRKAHPYEEPSIDVFPTLLSL